MAKLKSKPRDDKSEDTYNVKIDEDDPDKVFYQSISWFSRDVVLMFDNFS